VDNTQNGPVIPLSAGSEHKPAGQSHPKGPDNTQSDGLRPARGYSWPPFAQGHELSLKDGAWSRRKIGDEAEVIRAELLTVRPDLAAPEWAPLVDLYSQQAGSASMKHKSMQRNGANGAPIPDRSAEAASALTKVAKELLNEMGAGPRAAAELRQIQAQTALTMSVLVREAPGVLEAMRQTLSALGLAERCDEFGQVFAQKLALVAGDDDDDE
jgi:hypothetical protein